MSDDTAVRCARCSTVQPSAAARFCHRCGCDHHGSGDQTAERYTRDTSFVACPRESVRTPNAVSTLLPMSSGDGVRSYEIAIAVGIGAAVLAAVVGWTAFAIVAAAVAVPVVFAVYLYDVNEWEDQPVPVVIATVVGAGLLGAMAGFLLGDVLLDASDTVALGGSSSDWRRLFVLGVIGPLLALVLGSLGPLWLASRPRFDDLFDGLTFGAVAGAAYAAGETLIAHRGVLAGGGDRGDVALWLSIVVNAAAVKPVVYGAALGIAGASFSGVGAGYEGFGRRFARGAGVAAAGMVAYGAGVAIADNWIGGSVGAAVAVLWGIVVAVALLVVLRTLVQLAVLEAALAAAGGKPSRHEVATGAECGECRLPLPALALFCSGCGASVRATSKLRRHTNVAGVGGLDNGVHP